MFDTSGPNAWLTEPPTPEETLRAAPAVRLRVRHLWTVVRTQPPSTWTGEAAGMLQAAIREQRLNQRFQAMRQQARTAIAGLRVGDAVRVAAYQGQQAGTVKQINNFDVIVTFTTEHGLAHSRRTGQPARVHEMSIETRRFRCVDGAWHTVPLERGY